MNAASKHVTSNEATSSANFEKRRRKRQDGNYDIVPVFITTRDGYLKAAMRDPMPFAGAR